MSWLVSNDDDVNSRSIPSSSLLQASPDPIKLLAQKLFTEEHVRLENQQSGGRNSCGTETPASSALQTNWLRRTGWETTFRKVRCDVLVRLTALPHCTDNRPLPLGVVEGDAIISPARDERRLLFMIAALDRLLDQCGETVRTTDVCLRRWLRGRFPDRPYKMPFELVAKSSSEKVYRKELKRFVCFWLRLFRLLPTTFQKVTGHKLKKHQFRVLRELWVDDIWKSGEHVDVDPAADKDGGYDGDEGEYEYQDNDEDEDEIQDDDEGEDDEDDDGDEDDERYNEIEDESQKSVVVNTGDPSDAEVMSTWSSNSQENHPQDPALDILLRFCYSAVTEDFDGGVASSTMLVQDLPNYPQHPRRSTRKADIETYFEYVYLQTWASGASRAYWIVERDGRLVRPAVPVGSIRGLVSSGQDRTGDEQQDLIDSVKAREYQRNRRLVDGPGLAGDTQTAAAGSTTTYAEQRPWLERTRWETTYKNRDRSLLRRLIQAPYLQLH
ncbi:hypothetical protein IL306_001854, partial [Fusarium sp. DS 682]